MEIRQSAQGTFSVFLTHREKITLMFLIPTSIEIEQQAHIVLMYFFAVEGQLLSISYYRMMFLNFNC